MTNGTHDPGFGIEEAMELLRWAGYTVTGRPVPPRFRSREDVWRELERAVREGWSLNEIRRTLAIEHRTVKKYFPDAGWTVGGKGASMMASANRILK